MHCDIPSALITAGSTDGIRVCSWIMIPLPLPCSLPFQIRGCSKGQFLEASLPMPWLVSNIFRLQLKCTPAASPKCCFLFPERDITVLVTEMGLASRSALCKGLAEGFDAVSCQQDSVP